MPYKLYGQVQAGDRCPQLVRRHGEEFVTLCDLGLRLRELDVLAA